MRLNFEHVKMGDLPGKTMGILKRMCYPYDCGFLRRTLEQGSPATDIFIARNSEGDIVSWAAAQRSWKGTYDLDVWTAHRFRNKGAASRLLCFAYKKLKPRKKKILYPWTGNAYPSLDNLAKKFYRNRKSLKVR